MKASDLDTVFAFRETLLALGLTDQIPFTFTGNAQKDEAQARDWRQIMRRTFPAMIRVAQLVVWKPELWAIATAGGEAFAEVEVTADDIGRGPACGLMKNQLWYLPDDGRYSEAGYMIRALVVDHGMGADPTKLVQDGDGFISQASEGAIRDEVGLVVWGILQHRDRPSELGVSVCPMLYAGTVFETSNILLEAVAGLHFMRSKVATADARQFSRGLRRRSMKAGRELPDVRVVNLREADGRRQAAGSRDSDREYHHQWIVGWPFGHWRRQWYPSLGIHRPKLILPYRKGPEGAPLMTPRETVAKVVR